MDADAQFVRALADRYEIGREIGAGGMATVYVARDIKHDRNVAIKVLHPELAAVLGPERFLTEMRVTANLQHPHILPLFDSGTADGQLFYVMPLVEGESLRDRLNREQQLPIEEAVRIAIEVAGALDYAHRHKVVHRDIKPENILLHDGSALVADFGIALAVSNAGGTRLTQTGLSLGTPQYMSPEQATGEKNIDGRTDVYSLGCVLYEMLAGEPPFTGPNSQAIVARVLTESVRPLRARRDTVSPPLEAAVLTAVQKLPADRFATPLAFAAALRLGGQTFMPAFDPGVASRRQGWDLSLRPFLKIALVFIAIGAAAGYFAGRRGGSSTGAAPAAWYGELLGGPLVAMNPRVSHDGQYVAFAAMVDGQTQVGVLKPQSGAWKVLTNDLTRGIIADFSWSPDNSKIFYSRFLEVPRGVFSVSPLGTDERLVLDDAAYPDILPDGSMLVLRINANRDGQLHRFWPQSGRLDTLDVLMNAGAGNAFFRAFPDGKEAVFFGRPGTQKDSAAHLYAIDLTSKRVRRLAPGLTFDASTFAMTPDNRWVVMNGASGDLGVLAAVARDGSNRIQTLTFLPRTPFGFDVGPDGSLYFDQTERPAQLWRYNPTDRKSEARPIPPIAAAPGVLLPLPDGRALFVGPSGGGSRVMALAPGKEPSPFMGTDGETRGPLALVGADRVAMVAAVGGKWSVVIASIATGQMITRLPLGFPVSMAGSPDGKTLYYVDSRVVWAIPTDGLGTPKRIRDGDRVAMDPHGQYLVVELDDMQQVRLIRVPLSGGEGTEIVVHGDIHISANGLATNAVGPDGRIVVQVVPPGSWYWPLAILDPKTGKLDVLPESKYDMGGGWSSDGRVTYITWGIEANLWRYRPVGKKEP